MIRTGSNPAYFSCFLSRALPGRIYFPRWVKDSSSPKPGPGPYPSLESPCKLYSNGPARSQALVLTASVSAYPAQAGARMVEKGLGLCLPVCGSWPEEHWCLLGLGQGQDLPAISHCVPAILFPQYVPSWGQGFTASTVAGKPAAVWRASLRDWVGLVETLPHPSSMQKAAASNSREFLLTSGMWMGCPPK